MAKSLKILHVFRDPVGGIFRHVRDLLAEQCASGHEVGIICDATTGGEYEAKLFEEIRPQLKLGLHRIAMARSISPRDLVATFQVCSIARKMRPDVIHAHSAKGGVYGRIAARFASGKQSPVKAFYCPHGGAMHYEKHSLKGRIFFTAERLLEPLTHSLVFVSRYEQAAYHDKVGKPACPEQVVYNGLAPSEFEPVPAEPGAADFLFIGMKRDLKGPDVFLDAFAMVRKKTGRDVTALFVGDGPDTGKYHQLIKDLGIGDFVKELSAMPARKAFAMANIVVVPSRAESMPYLVLEAMAAQKPIVCTSVGGIPEIFSHAPELLVEPGNAEELAAAMLEKLNSGDAEKDAANEAERLKTQFSRSAMAANMEAIYRS